MRFRRVMKIGLIALVVLTLVAWIGVGLYFASQVVALPKQTLDVRDTTVVDIAGIGDTRAITVRAAAGSPALLPVTGGLELDGGGFIQLGPIQNHVGNVVTREARLLHGVWPPTGSKVISTAYGWPANPSEALGTPVGDVMIPDGKDALPAWQVSGTKPTWVIYVHGRGATRREALNVMRIGNRLGFPGLAIEYHGAPEGPKPPDGQIHFGLTEWHDVQAAVEYLKSTQHATHFVLVGYSLGGEIVSQFLAHSPDRQSVEGAILDAPLLDLDATLQLRARGYGIPGWLIRPILTSTEPIASIQGGLDFDDLNVVLQLANTSLPILLFHGTQDTSVPISTSRDLARLGQAHVTYIECKAEHVRCWNANPATYENAIATFLQEKTN